jgi:glutamine cyclotransferase
MKALNYLFFIGGILFLTSCEPDRPVEAPVPENNTPAVPKIPEIPYTVVAKLPHDSMCYTQGYLFYEGKLFESSGAPDEIPATRSIFGIVDQKTGKIDVKGELDKTKYFGEGITILNGKLYFLTWLGQTGYIYDAKTFKNLGSFGFMSKQGWGLTNDGKNLIMSDGSDVITYLDPNTFQTTKTLLVSESNYAVELLNELEYIKGFIYANIYTKNTIVKIDPETGNVVAKMDLSDLTTEAKKRYAGSKELNGIAYDPQSGRVLVTGKMWPTVYEIKFQF